jgi:hypothetical protein
MISFYFLLQKFDWKYLYKFCYKYVLFFLSHTIGWKANVCAALYDFP